MKLDHDGRSNWFSFLVKAKDAHFKEMMVSMAIMASITTFMVFLHETYNILEISVPSSFHTVLGLVVGLLLVFRTNTAYDRWWEGRKQLGALVNHTRNLAFNIETYLSEEKYPYKRKLANLILNYIGALKHHLRVADFAEVIEELDPELRKGFIDSQHKPNFILLQMARHVATLINNQLITDSQHLVIERDLSALTDIQGACERIRNTPMPLGYSLHLKFSTFIYITTLPIGFIDALRWWAIPIVLVIFFVMVGIEYIGEEIEDPFGTDKNDLPFDSIHQRLSANIREIFGR